MASARTSRPSASVLMISIVRPVIAVTMSPGRCAAPSGMFSTMPMTPTTLTFALRAASVCISPVTAAAPPMSPFMSSMPPAGLIEMPPVSNTTPLPTNASGASFALPPFQRMMTNRGGRAEPCATPSSARMPSFFICASVRTSTATPSSVNFFARCANSTGPSTFAGSLMRSRARAGWGAQGIASDVVLLARDLINEPANVLGPVEFAQRAKKLTELGVAVEVLTEAQMKKLGMRALLGVAQGSTRPPRSVIMRWNGGKAKEAPLAFVGKGVVFDTGGISIKPAGGMEDMKGDMGGAAAVTGLMHTLAARKAKVNVVGVIGIVENMPDGAAQRPGDIVTAMTGRTIEIINTDAEGRLVLADAIAYTEERFKPKFIIDLATLTGAIIVALGHLQAGMFASDDALANALSAAGTATGELVWRMPLSKDYDKLIDSKFADVKNAGARDAGSITAAHFIKRFVMNTPWVHLDIAGTALGSPHTDINRSWSSGWGVRLLDRLVADGYEG